MVKYDTSVLLFLWMLLSLLVVSYLLLLPYSVSSLLLVSLSKLLFLLLLSLPVAVASVDDDDQGPLPFYRSVSPTSHIRTRNADKHVPRPTYRDI